MPDVQEFQIIATPNPNEFGFRTPIHQNKLSKLTNFPVDGVTLYSGFELKINDRVSQWGNYLYTGSINGPDNYITFCWCKNKTETEKNTPFKVATKFGNHFWHPILKALEIIPDATSPRSYKLATGLNTTNLSGPSFYVREDYIPGVNEGTMFITEEFFAATLFQIGQYPTPQPSSVSYDVPGASGGFPECLHPDIVIPDFSSSTSMQIIGPGGGAGSASTVGSGNRGQSFPRTNFTSWTPYYISDDQVRTESGYHRTRIQVVPPPQPRLNIK